MSGYARMEARSNSQLLVSLMLLGVFCSQSLALPLETYSTMRLGNGMLFDGPNEHDQNPGLLKVENDYLESLLPENDISLGGGPRPLNRNVANPIYQKQADQIFTDAYGNVLRKAKLRKTIDDLLPGEKSKMKNKPQT